MGGSANEGVLYLLLEPLPVHLRHYESPCVQRVHHTSSYSSLSLWKQSSFSRFYDVCRSATPLIPQCIAPLSELQRLLLSFRLVSVSFTSFPVCRFSRDVVAVSSRQHAFCSLTKGFSKVSHHENVYLCGEVEKTCSRWSRCQSIGLSYQCSVATFSASCQIVTPTISRVR